MKGVYCRIAKVYLNDWKNTSSQRFISFEILENNIQIKKLKNLSNFNKFLSKETNFFDFVYYLKNEKICDINSILEFLVQNNEWSIVEKITTTEDIKNCYIGKKIKYHLHEIILMRFIDIANEGKLEQKHINYLKQMNIDKNFIGASIVDKVKNLAQESVEEKSSLLEVKILFEFFHFLDSLSIVSNDFFRYLISISIKYKNLVFLSFLESYFPDDFYFLVIDTLNFDFIDKVYQKYPESFKKAKYIKKIIKKYYEDSSASENDVYRIIKFLNDKSLNCFEVENELLSQIINSPFHHSSKHSIIVFLISLGIIDKNNFVIENLKSISRIHPFIFDVLINSYSEENLAINITGSKSYSKRVLVSKLMGNLHEDKTQGQIIFMNLCIHKLKINKDIVFNNLKETPQLRYLSLNTINKIIYVCSFFNEREKMNLMNSLVVSQVNEIHNCYELLSILSNTKNFEFDLVKNPKNFIEINLSLEPIKEIIKTININLGINNFACFIEKQKFKDFKIFVPKNAEELRNVGKEFKNCLFQDRHSKYVSNIILKNLIVFTLKNEHTKYCVSINPFTQKILKAKSIGQEDMGYTLVCDLRFFLEEIDYGNCVF